MLQSLEQLEKQISRTEQQLLYHLVMEQRETNRLLKEVLGNKVESDPIDDMKRPELMKRFAQLENKPTGWNRWDTEDIRKHLKEAS